LRAGRRVGVVLRRRTLFRIALTSFGVQAIVRGLSGSSVEAVRGLLLLSENGLPISRLRQSPPRRNGLTQRPRNGGVLQSPVPDAHAVALRCSGGRSF